MADILYDPACEDCRHDAAKDPAGTTWQCAGHVRAERDWLRARLALVMSVDEEDKMRTEILQKEAAEALSFWKKRALFAEAKVANNWLISEHYETVCAERDRLRERLDQFEAYGMPNVAAALDRIDAAEREREEAREAAERCADAATDEIERWQSRALAAESERDSLRDQLAALSHLGTGAGRRAG